MRAVCPTATIIYSQPIAVAGAIPGAYSSRIPVTISLWMARGPSRADTCRFMSVLLIIDGLGIVMRLRCEEVRCMVFWEALAALKSEEHIYSK
jgi:hypothetical protein